MEIRPLELSEIDIAVPVVLVWLFVIFISVVKLLFF